MAARPRWRRATSQRACTSETAALQNALVRARCGRRVRSRVHTSRDSKHTHASTSPVTSDHRHVVPSLPTSARRHAVPACPTLPAQPTAASPTAASPTEASPTPEPPIADLRTTPPRQYAPPTASQSNDRLGTHRMRRRHAPCGLRFEFALRVFEPRGAVSCRANKVASGGTAAAGGPPWWPAQEPRSADRLHRGTSGNDALRAGVHAAVCARVRDALSV